MEYLVIIIFLLIALVVLKIIFGYNKKQIKQFAENKELDEVAEKYPDNIEICKEYLKMLNNENVEIEEDKQAENSLYIAISNKILIANVRKSYTRIQTIAHECLHSIQDRRFNISGVDINGASIQEKSGGKFCFSSCRQAAQGSEK